MPILNDVLIHAHCQPSFAKAIYPVNSTYGRSEVTRPLYVPYGQTYDAAVRAIDQLVLAEAKHVADLDHNFIASYTAEPEKWRPHTVNLLPKEQYELRCSQGRPMIEPFVPHQVRIRSKLKHSATDGIENDVYEQEKILSYGLSSAGYDVRLAEDFALFTNISSVVIDPLNFDERTLHRTKANAEGYVILPPNSYLLGHTVETFNIPRDVMVVCVGKSTYARAGCVINVTPIEPGFSGTVVIEVANTTNLPMKIYAGMGIAQFLFFQASGPCRVSYGDRAGKYQNQQGLVTPKG